MTCFQDLWISYRGPIDSLYVCGERFSVSELTEHCPYHRPRCQSTLSMVTDGPHAADITLITSGGAGADI